MSVGLDVELFPRKRFGIFTPKISYAKIVPALEKLQKEDFGIPDLAVEAGLKEPGKAFFSFEQTVNGISVDFGASEEVKLYFNTERNCIESSNSTTCFGPGYHWMLTNFFERLAQEASLKPVFHDEIGFWENRDKDFLKKEFVSWFKGLFTYVAENLPQPDWYLCWPLYSYKLQTMPENSCVTPAGLLNFSQVPKMLENIEHSADDFFLFLPNFCKDALHYRNNALNKLWCNFRFTTDDADHILGETIAESLEFSAQLDPQLPFPKRAYQELCRILERTPIELATVAEAPQFEEVGFRKYPIYLDLPDNWRVHLPGDTPIAKGECHYKVASSEIEMDFECGYYNISKPIPPDYDFSSLPVSCDDPKCGEEIRTCKFDNGNGIVYGYNDSAIPVVLYAELYARNEEKNVLEVLIIFVKAVNLQKIQWAEEVIANIEKFGAKQP